MNCSNCNAADETGIFCTSCGAKLADQSSQPNQQLSKATSEKLAESFAHSSEPAPSEDGVELAKEVFTEKIEQLQQQTDISEPPRTTAAVVSESIPNKVPATPVATTSGLAIGALVSVFFIPLLGLILGYVAKKDIASSGGMKTGSGLATASIVLGWIFVGFGALFTLLVVVAVALNPS